MTAPDSAFNSEVVAVGADPPGCEAWSTERTPRYSWVDPDEIAELGRGLGGLAFTRYLLDLGEAGRVPIASTLGFRLAEVELGTVVNRGRRTVLASAELRDATDRLIACATSSCMLFPLEA